MDTLDIAFAEARNYLNSLDTRPVASRGTPDEIRLPLPAQFPERGMPANDVVRAIAAAAEPGLTGNAGGIGGGHYVLCMGSERGACLHQPCWRGS
jgi:hypothetical protein